MLLQAVHPQVQQQASQAYNASIPDRIWLTDRYQGNEQEYRTLHVRHHRKLNPGLQADSFVSDVIANHPMEDEQYIDCLFWQHACQTAVPGCVQRVYLNSWPALRALVNRFPIVAALSSPCRHPLGIWA